MTQTHLVSKLALEDGTVFTGRAAGPSGTRTGEVVFNTAMTGYQEVFTDPSYCGQIVVMTFPHIGNYGVNDDDIESAKVHLSGVVIRELTERPSNYRAARALRDLFEQQQVAALVGVDTRAITRRIRAQGALNGVLSTEILDDLELVRMARAAAPMSGSNLVARVSPRDAREWSERPLALDRRGDVSAPPAACRIVVLDCGVKHNILRRLAEQGAAVTVLPASATAAEVLAQQPDGVVLGNGPGDPAAVTDTIAEVRKLLGKTPIFGICLGQQLLALALGGRTYKLPFGHHGANVPVLNLPGQRVEITSQNHGFAVDAASIEGVGGRVTHINLNDSSVEGFAHREAGVVAVQFHPEAAPGPHDAGYLFERFAAAVRDRRRVSDELLV